MFFSFASLFNIWVFMFFSSNRVAGKGIFFSSQQRFFQNCFMLIVWVLRTSSRKMKLVVKSWMLLNWVTRLRNFHQISLSLLQDIPLCYSNPEWQIFIFSTGGLGHPDLAVNWTPVLWTSISYTTYNQGGRDLLYFLFTWHSVEPCISARFPYVV